MKADKHLADALCEKVKEILSRPIGKDEKKAEIVYLLSGEYRGTKGQLDVCETLQGIPGHFTVIGDFGGEQVYIVNVRPDKVLAAIGTLS